MSLQSRINKKLVEPTQWYKKKIEEGEEEEGGEERVNRELQSQGWTERKRGRGRRKPKRENKKERDNGRVEGVLFLPHTNMSELAKRVRGRLDIFEEFSKLKVKVVERAGEKLVDVIHKSNPWDMSQCSREDCRFCNSKEEKLWGKCKCRNIVYENECMTCLEEEESNEKEKKEDK